MSTRILRLARVLSVECVFTSTCPLTPSLSTVVLLRCLSALSSVICCPSWHWQIAILSPRPVTPAIVIVSPMLSHHRAHRLFLSIVFKKQWHFYFFLAVSVWRPSNCLVGTSAHLIWQQRSAQSKHHYLSVKWLNRHHYIALYFTFSSCYPSLGTYKWQLKPFQFTALCSFRFFLSFTNSKRLHYLLVSVSLKPYFFYFLPSAWSKVIELSLNGCGCWCCCCYLSFYYSSWRDLILRDWRTVAFSLGMNQVTGTHTWVVCHSMTASEPCDALLH